jgi:peptidoglycan hydrolase-like protein with peptidoglycan-binding domain
LAGPRAGWLLALAVLALNAFAGPSGGERAAAQEGTYYPYWLGARDLRLGDRGADVKTLNWALRSSSLGTGHHGSFDQQTDWAVRVIQRESGLHDNGVVGQLTRKAIATRMANQRATWYGPGLFGRRTACGRTLTPKTIGVAHRTLPCGTRVAFAYQGHWLRAKVIDRGPFRKGFRWDLTRKLAKQLGVTAVGTATVKAGVAP